MYWLLQSREHLESGAEKQVGQPKGCIVMCIAHTSEGWDAGLQYQGSGNQSSSIFQRTSSFATLQAMSFSSRSQRLRDTKLLCKGQQDEADVPYCKILAHFLWQQNAAKAAPKMLFFLFLSTAWCPPCLLRTMSVFFPQHNSSMFHHPEQFLWWVTATQTFMVSKFPHGCSQRQSSNGDEVRNKHSHVASCTRVPWHSMTSGTTYFRQRMMPQTRQAHWAQHQDSRNLPLCPGISSKCSGIWGVSLRKQKQDSPLCLILSALRARSCLICHAAGREEMEAPVPWSPASQVYVRAWMCWDPASLSESAQEKCHHLFLSAGPACISSKRRLS